MVKLNCYKPDYYLRFIFSGIDEDAHTGRKGKDTGR
jgi:hypothetical protein